MPNTGIAFLAAQLVPMLFACLMALLVLFWPARWQQISSSLRQRLGMRAVLYTQAMVSRWRVVAFLILILAAFDLRKILHQWFEIYSGKLL